MAIAILGDTHMPKGTRRLPAACVELLEASELIVHTGDFTAAVIHDELAGLGPPLVAVHGNVDDLALVRRLPKTAIFSVGTRQVALIHDAGPKGGRLGRMRKRFPEADAVLFGHSHLPLHERADPDDPLSFQIFNPGSPTERRRAPQRSIGRIDLDRSGSLALRHVWLG
ncbi:MAG: metallophosphoesterase family protein [Solirubrobacterales bacterium]|nr:metallophosphoesterase family protein [Solirubrobacterales bacterium]